MSKTDPPMNSIDRPVYCNEFKIKKKFAYK